MDSRKWVVFDKSASKNQIAYVRFKEYDHGWEISWSKWNVQCAKWSITVLSCFEKKYQLNVFWLGDLIDIRVFHYFIINLAMDTTWFASMDIFFLLSLDCMNSWTSIRSVMLLTCHLLITWHIIYGSLIEIT